MPVLISSTSVSFGSASFPPACLILAGHPKRKNHGAGNEIRTRDTKLGKLVLYQLSYARPGSSIKIDKKSEIVNIKNRAVLKTLKENLDWAGLLVYY